MCVLQSETRVKTNYTGQQISKKFLYLWWICYYFICLHLWS